MSAVHLVLGTEIDIATGDEVRSAVRSGTENIMRRLSRDRGIRKRPIASYSQPVAAMGTFVLDLGSPPAGTVWMLVEVVVTADSDRTAPAGAVSALYAGPPARQNGVAIFDTPSIGNIVRPAVAIPSVHAFSGETYPVHDGENLMAIVYSLTTTVTTLAAVATVMELSASAVSLDVIP